MTGFCLGMFVYSFLVGGWRNLKGMDGRVLELEARKLAKEQKISYRQALAKIRGVKNV